MEIATIPKPVEGRHRISYQHNIYSKAAAYLVIVVKDGGLLYEKTQTSLCLLLIPYESFDYGQGKYDAQRSLITPYSFSSVLLSFL